MNKKIFSIVGIVLILGTMLFVLTGCGNKRTNGTNKIVISNGDISVNGEKCIVSYESIEEGRVDIRISTSIDKKKDLWEDAIKEVLTFFFNKYNCNINDNITISITNNENFEFAFWMSRPYDHSKNDYSNPTIYWYKSLANPIEEEWKP